MVTESATRTLIFLSVTSVRTKQKKGQLKSIVINIKQIRKTYQEDKHAKTNESITRIEGNISSES